MAVRNLQEAEAGGGFFGRLRRFDAEELRGFGHAPAERPNNAGPGPDHSRAAFNGKAPDAPDIAATDEPAPEAAGAKVIEFPGKTKRRKSDKPNDDRLGFRMT